MSYAKVPNETRTVELKTGHYIAPPAAPVGSERDALDVLLRALAARSAGAVESIYRHPTDFDWLKEQCRLFHLTLGAAKERLGTGSLDDAYEQLINAALRLDRLVCEWRALERNLRGKCAVCGEGNDPSSDSFFNVRFKTMLVIHGRCRREGEYEHYIAGETERHHAGDARGGSTPSWLSTRTASRASS